MTRFEFFMFLFISLMIGVCFGIIIGWYL